MSIPRLRLRNMLRRSTTPILPSTPPVNTALPVVSGAALTGDMLITTDGGWTNAPTSFERKWQVAPGPAYSAWVDISGATTGMFLQTAAQQGYKLRSAVRALNSAGAGEWEYSAPTAVSTAPPNVNPYDILVTSEADWDSVFAMTDAQRAGKIIAVRNTGTPYAPRTVTWRPATLTKIVAENQANPPILLRWAHDTSANLLWEYIQFGCEIASAAANCTSYISRPAGGYLRDQTFKTCGYIGNYRGILDNPAFDPTNPLYPEYACVLPTFTSGVLTGLAPSYVVGADGKAFNLDYVGDLVPNGTGYSLTFNNVQSSGGIFWPTGAVKPVATFDVVNGRMVNFTIVNGGSGALNYKSSASTPVANGYYRAGGVTFVIGWTGRTPMSSILPGAFAVDSSSGGINTTSGVVLRGTWRYEDCYVRMVGDAFKHPAAEYHEMIRCQVQSVYQDAYSLGISEGVKRITMINCDAVHIFSADGHPNDPHSDATLQAFFTATGAGKRVSDLEIIIQGNTLRTPNWENAQGIFLQSNVTPKVSYVGIISHNAIQSRRQGNTVYCDQMKNMIQWRNVATHYHLDNVNQRDWDASIAGEHANTLKFDPGVCLELNLRGKNVGEKFVAKTGAGTLDDTSFPNLTVGVQYATIPGNALFANYTGPQTRAQQLAQLALKAPYADAAYGLADGGFDFTSDVPQAADIPTYTQFTPLTAQPLSSNVWTAWTPVLSPGGTVNFSSTGNVQVADDASGTNATAGATSGSFATTMTARKYIRVQIATGASAGVQTSATVTLNGFAYTASATT